MPFTELPLDIYFNFCYFLDPLDIIALGQTCSSLRTVSQERTVWVEALKRSCDENQILSTTFNPRKMSLNEIKHASTAPSRVLSKICKGPPIDAGNGPLAHQLHSTHAISLDTIGQGIFRRVCLVPGGRLLLAYVDGEIILYDLQVGQPVSSKGAPLRIKHSNDLSFMPCPSPDGKELRVVMSQSLPNPQSGTEISVFCFIFDHKQNDGGASVQVVLHSAILSAWATTFGYGPYTTSGDLIIFCDHDQVSHQKILGIWNCIENTFAGWLIPIERYREVFLDRNYIVLVTEESLHYWEIPPLVPQPKGRIQGPIQNPPPTFSVPLSFSDPVSSMPRRGRPEVYCARLFDWYNTFGRLSSFDFLMETPKYEAFTKFTLPLYGSVFSDPAAATQLPPSPPHSVTMFKKKISDEDRVGGMSSVSVSPYSLCNGWTIKTFMEDGRVFVTAEEKVKRRGKAEPVVELVLPEGFQNAVDPHYALARREFYFDPVSGRLAYLADGSTRIVVVDYLTYPQ
ncbi:hypothetical protein BJ165DRAFT_1452498 [Panaeolus papilionaceus]|nr:hypothetical protein BJ165DRAFT_1452498 [Panaeolus papilionaceus]